MPIVNAFDTLNYVAKYTLRDLCWLCLLKTPNSGEILEILAPRP